MNKQFGKWTFFPVLLLILAVALVVGCTPVPAPAPKPAPAATTPRNVVISTGQPGSSAEAFSQNFAQMVTNRSGGTLKANVVPNQGIPQQTLTLINSGDIAIHSNTAEMYRLYNGIGQYQTMKTSDLRSLWPSVPIWSIGVALQSSKADTFQDLKGLRISTDTAGTTVETLLLQLLEVMGLDPAKDVTIRRVGFNQAINELRDGGSDVGFLTAGQPNAAVTELEVLKPIKFLDVSPDLIKKVNDKFYAGQALWGMNTLKKGEFYKTPPKDYQLAILTTFAVASKNKDADLVYRLTKMFWENKSELEKVWAPAKQITKDLLPLINGPVWPLHDGALKYYNEVGWKVTR